MDFHQRFTIYLILYTITSRKYKLCLVEFEGEKETMTEREDKTTAVTNTTTAFKSPDQLSDELVTLSLLPQSRWRHLTSLELIKVSWGYCILFPFPSFSK